MRDFSPPGRPTLRRPIESRERHSRRAALVTFCMNQEHRRIRVAIVFGGRTAEHEVSLQSAKNIVEAIDKDKYDVVLIGIDKNGRWLLNEASTYLLNSNNPKLIALNRDAKEVALVATSRDSHLLDVETKLDQGSVDVVFPVLHGPYGEDGSIQGLLKLASIPCVGANILSSAINMDKDVMKRLLREAGLPVVRLLTLRRDSSAKPSFEEVTGKLGSPIFVKPANLGSSIGVHKVSSSEEFGSAVADAFQFDNKILVEEAIHGREVECSVLGNDKPDASIPGEIVPNADFYSYQSKYIDDGAALKIPADLPAETVTRVQDLAIRAFKSLECEGMARVDFFVKDDADIIINEVNTIPGFTRISMYPKLWEASGLSYPDLIDRLIQLAIERAQRDGQLKTSIELS